MSLNRIIPGDALDASEVTANFADLDTLTVDVLDEQIVTSSVDYRHLTGAYKYVDFELDDTDYPGVILGQVIAGPATITCHANVPLFVLVTVDLDFTGAGAVCELRLRSDPSGSPNTERRTIVSQLNATERVPVQFAATITPTSSSIELDVFGLGALATNWTSRMARFDVFSPLR